MGEHRAPEPVPEPDPAAALKKLAQPEVTGAIWTKQFWKDAAERAIKAFCGGFAAGLVVLVVRKAQPFHLIWYDVLALALLATVFSLCLSIASIPFGTKGMPSVIKKPAGNG